MISNKVKPVSDTSNISGQVYGDGSSLVGFVATRDNSYTSKQYYNEKNFMSTAEDTSFLKLKPFKGLDPSLVRLLKFFQYFGLLVDSDVITAHGKPGEQRRRRYVRYMKLTITIMVAIVTSEVVYDVNLRQSKLLAEQKRSTPLLTFVIVGYSWLTLIIPLICDFSLIVIGPYLFRFYSRTTATICNGIYFGKDTSSDTSFYSLVLSLLALLDVIGQVVLLGVWPSCINPYMSMFWSQDSSSIPVVGESVDLQNRSNVLDPTLNVLPVNATIGVVGELAKLSTEPRITAHLLDLILGETYAHNDIGVCIKIICLIIQFAHTYSFLVIIISLADHYTTVINSINDNLDKYNFRTLLKQLIILRDSSEQISMMISLPFSLIILLVFMRQIALNGVFIQSTMQPYENWAVSLQSFTCSVCIFMVFIYCDGLMSASKQTHRLKTEQTVINETRGGNQSIYDYLDYLDRLSKSIRITFFGIISINKSSLVGLYGHILSLTFVTS